jgi:hypothetical protein
MPTNPDIPAEMTRQIDAGSPDAAKLVEIGFSWNTAFAIARQIATGGNAQILAKAGLPSPLAKAIADACDVAIEARAALEPPKPVRTARGLYRRDDAA